MMDPTKSEWRPYGPQIPRNPEFVAFPTADASAPPADKTIHVVPNPQPNDVSLGKRRMVLSTLIHKDGLI